jgi:hypothetical protein
MVPVVVLVRGATLVFARLSLVIELRAFATAVLRTPVLALSPKPLPVSDFFSIDMKAPF